jgi:hypothetical protein
MCAELKRFNFEGNESLFGLRVGWVIQTLSEMNLPLLPAIWFLSRVTWAR